MGYLFAIVHVVVWGVIVSIAWKAAGMEEHSSPLLWAVASSLVYAVTWLVLGWGWVMLIVAQVLLGVAVGVVRALAHRPAA
jgi:hypothetical protein